MTILGGLEDFLSGGSALKGHFCLGFSIGIYFLDILLVSTCSRQGLIIGGLNWKIQWKHLAWYYVLPDMLFFNCMIDSISLSHGFSHDFS